MIIGTSCTRWASQTKTVCPPLDTPGLPITRNVTPAPASPGEAVLKDVSSIVASSSAFLERKFTLLTNTLKM